MALCGIPRIDNLNVGAASAKAIGPGDPDRESVGVIQGLLAGHGGNVPNLLSPHYGIFGELTSAVVLRFRAQHSLPAGNEVDAQTLQSLVQSPATAPIASRGYLTLALDFEYGGLAKILSVVAQMEGAGKFGALNSNTDKAGLSFGLIQWAQKPGRLAEILKALFAASAEDFVRILGAGDSKLASGLIAHSERIDGGIRVATGETIDPAFDLIREPWVSRFREAALWKRFQQVQVRTALNDFRGSLALIEQIAPQLNSERAAGFMLDLSNQFGDSGARDIYRRVSRAGMTINEALQAMADESVERVHDPWKAATQARRQHFLTGDYLSDDLFGDDLFADPGPGRQPPGRVTAWTPPSAKIASS
jgi:hypothetical protein